MNQILHLRGAILFLFVSVCLWPGRLSAQVTFIDRVMLPIGHNNILRQATQPAQTDNPFYNPALNGGKELYLVTGKEFYEVTSLPSSPGGVTFPAGFPFPADLLLTPTSIAVVPYRQMEDSGGAYATTFCMAGARRAFYKYRVDVNSKVSGFFAAAPGEPILPFVAPSAMANDHGLFLMAGANTVYSNANLEGSNFANPLYFAIRFGGTGTGDGQFTNLTSMAFGPGPKGLLYCLDLVPAPGISRVEVFDPTDPNGNYFRYTIDLPFNPTPNPVPNPPVGTSAFGDYGFTINDQGHMLIGDGQGGGTELDLAGHVLCTFDPPADDGTDPNADPQSGPLPSPSQSSIWFDTAGDIFVEVGATGMHRYFDTQAASVSRTHVAQGIAFPAAGNGGIGGTTTLTATASSGLPVTYRVISGPATVSGNVVTYTGAGTVIVAADQPGDSTYVAAKQVRQTIAVVNETPQTLTPFDAIADQDFEAHSLTLNLPTASSGLPVSVTVQSGPAILSGNTLTFTDTGVVVLAAYQAGDGTNNPVQEVTSFNVTAPEFTTISVGGAATVIAYTGTGGDVVVPSTLKGLPVTVIGPNALASIPALTSIVLPDSVTTIGIEAFMGDGLTSVTFGSGLADIEMGAFWNNPALSSMTFTGNAPTQETSLSNTGPNPGAGPYAPLTISYYQGATGFTSPTWADSDGDTFATTVLPQQSQTITFPVIGNQTYGVQPITLNATSSSGLPVTYKTTGPIRVSGNILTIIGAGNAAVGAYQAGNLAYAPAVEARQTFTIRALTQTITFPAIPDKTFGAAAVTLKASSTSGLTITYTVLSGPATVSGRQLTLTGGGIVQLAANQPGNSIYGAAAEVITTLLVKPAKQTITFAAIGNQTFPTAPITLAATSTSGLPVTYKTTGPVHVSGHTLTITGPGNAAIGAYQAGSASYTAAREVRQTFTVTAGTGT